MVANPRSLGKFYWHPLIYPVKPKEFWEKAETQEIEHPFRHGVGVSVRLPLTRLAMVLGRWKRKLEESQALTNAIAGRTMLDEEINWNFIRYGAGENKSV